MLLTIHDLAHAAQAAHAFRLVGVAWLARCFNRFRLPARAQPR